MSVTNSLHQALILLIVGIGTGEILHEQDESLHLLAGTAMPKSETGHVAVETIAKSHAETETIISVGTGKIETGTMATVTVSAMIMAVGIWTGRVMKIQDAGGTMANATSALLRAETESATGTENVAGTDGSRHTTESAQKIATLALNAMGETDAVVQAWTTRRTKMTGRSAKRRRSRPGWRHMFLQRQVAAFLADAWLTVNWTAFRLGRRA